MFSPKPCARSFNRSRIKYAMYISLNELHSSFNMFLYTSDVYISIETPNVFLADPSSNFGQTNHQPFSRRNGIFFFRSISTGGSLLPGSCQLCRHPPPTTAGLFLPATPTPDQLGGQPPRARKPLPNLPRCACADLRVRSALSTPPCSVTRVGIPLGLQLLPPAFARWRSAFG
jgi:hypothetical protein